MTLQGDEYFDIDSDSLNGVNRGHQHTGGGDAQQGGGRLSIYDTSRTDQIRTDQISPNLQAARQ
ncbi:MAG: hypothetical protein ACK5QQ_13005 [Cyanobacteriota bacterium]